MSVDLLQRLEGVRQVGPRQWVAKCSGHDDRNPSLSVSIGHDGRWLVYCFAGCELEAICAGAGIRVADLFVGRAPWSGGPQLAQMQRIACAVKRDEAAGVAPPATNGRSPAVTEPEPRPGALVRTASQVRSRALRWLWPGRLAIQYATVTTGMETIGKSVFWCWVMARLTCGELDGGPDEPVNVLIVAREDGVEDTWKPRLALAGADLDRCYFIRFEALDADWNLRDGIDALREAVGQTDPRLLLIDAVLEHMPEPKGGENINSPTFVRRAIAPFVGLLREVDAAGVISMHPPKGVSAGSEFRDLVQSSQAWTAVSRLGLLVTWHPDDVELADEEQRRRVVLRGMGNFGRNPGALEFRIVGRTYRYDDGETQEREVVDQVAPSNVTRRDLAKAAGDSKVAHAAALMRAALADGEWHPSKSIYALLEAVELSAAGTVAAAKTLAGVEVHKTGFEGGWGWRLKPGSVAKVEPSAPARAGSESPEPSEVPSPDPSRRNRDSVEGSRFVTDSSSVDRKGPEGSDGSLHAHARTKTGFSPEALARAARSARAEGRRR